MNYIQDINKIVQEKVLEPEKIALFGQNISAGSCLGGLCKNLKVREKGIIINTPNSENTLCGVGFGLLMNEIPSIFFMKQLDFLFLGIDQLVNTYNFIRKKNINSSFTIMPTIVDLGYQGLQSSSNNFSDFCSLARIKGYTITNKHDADEILNNHLISPGFRIIGLSQRLFNQEIIEFKEEVYSNEDKSLFQYSYGKDLSIVCFNFSLPYGNDIKNKLSEMNINSSLFSVNSVTPIKWDKIIESSKDTKKLILIDDSKSENLSMYSFLSNVYENCSIEQKLIIKREFNDNSWLSVNDDLLKINYNEILNTFKN